MTDPNFQWKIPRNGSVQQRNRTFSKESQKNGVLEATNKINEKHPNSIKIEKTPESGFLSEDQNHSQEDKDKSIENDLSMLQRQISQLKPIQRNEAKLRFESEAYVCRRRRNNLFRSYEKKIEKLQNLNSDHKGFLLENLMKGKKPTTKNAIKLQKILNNFLSRGVQRPKYSQIIQYLSAKHKVPIEGFANNTHSQKGYKQSDFRKIRKYQIVIQKNPPLGYIFSQDNVKKENEDYQDQEEDIEQNLQQTNNQYQYQIKPLISGYRLPEQHFSKIFTDSKRQIFKLARTMTRMKLQKQGILKRMAYMAVKEVQRKYLRSQRNQNQFITRAKKLQRECVVYWRKREKQLIEIRKRKQKLQAQLRKRDQEQQQALRQEKRLQYIMHQSEIYSHFMATKLGMEGELKKQMNKIEDIDKKKVSIDEEAAQLVVNQIINNKADNLQKFAKPGKLDLSSVDQVSSRDLIGPAPSFIGVLKEYQIKGLRWLNNLFEQGISGILADQMGLGKTIQAIALLSHISYNKNVWGPFLIVAPNSTLFNWQQQFKKFCPSLRVLPYWGSIKQRKTIRKFFSQKKFTQKADSPFHVVITSYQLTVTDQKAFKRLKWQLMILDQAQAIKNILSQRWNTLKQFQAKSRLLLSGTPIQNNMAQLWALLNFIMPELFDSHQLFNEWFSKDIQAHSQDQKALDQIKIQRLHAILKPFMLRRVKKDVQHQIGKKIQHQILCQMTKRQKKLYDSIKEKLNLKQFFKMLQSKIKVQNLMNLVMQLRKVCNHPQLFERRPPKSPFLFQQLYYYTGYIPIRMGQQKLIAFNCHNPIVYNIPKLIYQNLIRFQQNLQARNMRLLNIYKISNQKNNPTFSITKMMSYTQNQIYVCWKEDILFSYLLFAHWLKTQQRFTNNFSIKEYINFMHFENNIDQRFLVSPTVIKSLLNVHITAVMAPTIIPIIPSNSFYNTQTLLSNNTFQKYIFEGRYKKKWGDFFDQSYEGLLPVREELTKLQVVDFGSLIADSSKLKQLDRILKEKKKNGDRVLIFCQMTKMLDILEDFMNMRKYTFFRLDGSSNLADRRDMVNQFQVNPKIFVFLLSTRAGGLGVTLTAANTVVFYDNDWNPTMDAQATDRAHRIGQRSDVFVYQLVTKSTIEQRIVKRAQQKKTVQSTVYEGVSFNFFKKDMIIELMCDQFNGGNQQDQKKKEGPVKKKGPKVKSKQQEQKEKDQMKPQ